MPKKFEIKTKAGRTLTAKHFENDLPAKASDKSYGPEFHKWKRKLIAKAKAAKPRP